MPHPPTSRLAIAICSLLLLVGTVGVVGSWGAYIVDSELQASGARAPGLVLKKDFLRVADGDSDYIIKYRFHLPSGELVVSQRGISKRLWSMLNPGSTITVVYSEANPKRNFPEGSGASSPTVAILASVVFGAVGVLGASTLHGILRQRRDA